MNDGVGDEEGDEEGDTPEGVVVGEVVIEVPERLVEKVRVRVWIAEADWDCEGDSEEVLVGDGDPCDQLRDMVSLTVVGLVTLPERNAVSGRVSVMDVVVLMPGVGLGVPDCVLLGLKVRVTVTEKLTLAVREVLWSREPEPEPVPLAASVRESEEDGVALRDAVPEDTDSEALPEPDLV